MVYGVAKTIEGKELSYKVVYKRQKKWERYGDLDSWRREYNLAAEELGWFQGGLYAQKPEVLRTLRA